MVVFDNNKNKSFGTIKTDIIMRRAVQVRAVQNGDNIDDLISGIDEELAALRRGQRPPIRNAVGYNNNNNADDDGPVTTTTTGLNRFAPDRFGNSYHSDDSTVDTMDSEESHHNNMEAEQAIADERKRMLNDLETAIKVYAEEKVKVVEEEKKIADDLKKNFESLKNQLVDYRTRYDEAKEKLWDAEEKEVEMQERIDVLQDENIAYLEDLKIANQEKNTRGSTVQSMNQRGDPFQQQRALVDDGMKNNQIRKALLFDDIEAEGGDVSYYDKVKNIGLINASINTLVRICTPFRKDIKKIRAHMGSSVAAYFVFSRFLFIHSICLSVVMCVYGAYHLGKQLYFLSIILTTPFLTYHLVYSLTPHLIPSLTHPRCLLVSVAVTDS